MTRRISNEDGVNAGLRNVGRLALSAIPFALGIGVSVWFGIYLGVHQFRRELSQEERAAIAVGAAVRPASQMVIDIRKENCIPITRADLDGRTLRLYAKNDCHRSLNYLEWHWALLSPAGTILSGGYTNHCALPTDPGDSAECVFEGSRQLESDDRAASVRVWTREIGQ